MAADVLELIPTKARVPEIDAASENANLIDVKKPPIPAPLPVVNCAAGILHAANDPATSAETYPKRLARVKTFVVVTVRAVAVPTTDGGRNPIIPWN